MTGIQAEELFIQVIDKPFRKASKREDMIEHWDFEVDGIKYDVKTQKKLNRWDEEPSDVIWIELTNVRGNPGWIKGNADKIAFLANSQFLIVDREKLFNFIVKFVPNLDIIYTKSYKRWYRRKGRLDTVTFVYPQDIQHLIERRITW